MTVRIRLSRGGSKKHPYYRVVASTHDTKDQAAQSRASLLGRFPDAWLLYQK